MYVISALYQFTHFPDFENMRAPLLERCLQNGVKGTLLLAHEGINGTIAGTREGIDNIISFIQSDQRFHKLEYKESFAEKQPFLRMKVKLKKEIVTMGVTDINPLENVGQYVEPDQWDALISDPDTILIDTRNDYEFEIGSFKGAINPVTETFREFPEYVAQNLDPAKHKKVAMFCTGGIRCEKATSYMVKLGFENVYHLKGGILKYLEHIPADESSWEGECFVFDERVAVNHDLEPGQYDQCYACRYPLSQEEMQSPLYEKGVSCPKCHDKITPQKRARFEERQKQMELARQRNSQHLGQKIVKKQG